MKSLMVVIFFLLTEQAFAHGAAQLSDEPSFPCQNFRSAPPPQGWIPACKDVVQALYSDIEISRETSRTICAGNMDPNDLGRLGVLVRENSVQPRYKTNQSFIGPWLEITTDQNNLHVLKIVERVILRTQVNEGTLAIPHMVEHDSIKSDWGCNLRLRIYLRKSRKFGMRRTRSPNQNA